ncbi:hypothetical protein F511_41954 [Dorcoceras hygrometricum]|uniref:Uncharacterized protein n=1 Tax=Dorcoceras hygrometricum TaxID=472368 RepID=A0A2Z7D534_9LAMI|nr:hypothetical protein F511_41954 [Dorcoceras hygrometricum]
MHLVFGCCITASGSLPHCEHTPWPLLFQILGAVFEFLSSLVGRAFGHYPVLQLVVALTQLVVPQEMMPPRRRGRGRRQFQESGGQNEDRYSARTQTHGSSEEDEGTAALTTRNQQLSLSSPRSFCSFKWVAIEREVHKEPSATENTQSSTENDGNLGKKASVNSSSTRTQQSSRKLSSRNYPVASYPVATIQSQAIPKAGRILTTGTRHNPRNAAFQLNQTTSRCSLDWFLNSTAGHPVAILKTRSLTKSNDAVTHASIATRSCSPSRNTIPLATGSSILRLVILSRAQRLPDATQAQQLIFHFHQLQATITLKFQILPVVGYSTVEPQIVMNIREAQRFLPRGQQFKKKSSSGSSGSGSSSSSGSRTEFCGFCGGKHPSTQCVWCAGFLKPLWSIRAFCESVSVSWITTDRGPASGSWRRSDQTKRFDKIVQQQVTVAKSMRVNTTVACDWLNFEFQSLRLILVATGSRRANTRFNKESPRVGYCYVRGNQQREFFVNLLVYSSGNQQREFLTHLLVY